MEILYKPTFIKQFNKLDKKADSPYEEGELIIMKDSDIDYDGFNELAELTLQFQR